MDDLDDKMIFLEIRAVTGGVEAAACSGLLSDFFKELRSRRKK